MELSKIQKKNLWNVIKKYVNYGLDTRDDIYFLLMGYKCFQNESDEFLEKCIDEVIHFVYVETSYMEGI